MATSDDGLAALKVADLRERLRARGVSPGSLRKAELIERLRSLAGGPGAAEANGASAAAAPQAPQEPRAPRSGRAPRAPKMAAADAAASEEAAEGPARGRAEGRVDRSRFTKNLPATDWSLVFLGTASCVPSYSRFTCSTALQFQNANNGVWLFDAGEGIQMQLQKADFKASSIQKIFITHAHGDHLLGLVGVLCFMGQAGVRDPPVEIYGPEGLRAYLRAALQLTYSRVTRTYVVHELRGVAMLHRSPFFVATEKRIKIKADRRFGEVAEGRDIFPDRHGRFFLCSTEDGRSVWAAAMAHTVPTVGYVVREAERPGRLRSEVVMPLLKAHYDSIREATQRDPFTQAKAIKAMAPGEVYTFPDGSVLPYEEAMEAPCRGRRVVICGDTASADALRPLLLDTLSAEDPGVGACACDVLVHEATNALMPWEGGSAKALEAETASHGHSTPSMAGRTARRFGARRLVLNHFSPRYHGSDDPRSVNVMAHIEQAARKASGLRGNRVLASYDLMRMPVLPLDTDLSLDDGEDLVFQTTRKAPPPEEAAGRADGTG